MSGSAFLWYFNVHCAVLSSELYFPAMPFIILLYKVAVLMVLIKSLVTDCSNESCGAVLSCGAVYDTLHLVVLLLLSMDEICR